MSSKVYRPEDGVETSAFAWRPAGGEARMEPKAVAPQEIQPDLEAKTRAAYNQGVAAGEAAARQAAQQKLDPVLSALNNIVQELSGLRKKVRAEAEDDAVKLAIAIARRVLYRELSTDPEAILGLVKAAFSKVNSRETHRLRVSPSDAAVLQEHRAKLQLPEISMDGTLSPGSAIFETTRGELDASVDTQLGEIEKGLTDLISRRK